MLYGVLQRVTACYSLLQTSRQNTSGVAVYCSVLQCVAVCCSVLQCVAVCCRQLVRIHPAGLCNICVIQCAAVCCSMLQRVAACCTVCCRHLIRVHPALQCVAECYSVLQRVAVCCSVLQCVAVCCSVLQCVAVCGKHLIRIHSASFRDLFSIFFLHSPSLPPIRGVSEVRDIFFSALQIVTVCCSVLQYVAACCSFPLAAEPADSRV